MTENELKATLKNFLDEEGKLKSYPAKMKLRLYALCYLTGKFEQGVEYTESDVNGTLNKWHLFGDAATVRREMINNGFLVRERDGSAYRVNPSQPAIEDIIAAIR